MFLRCKNAVRTIPRRAPREVRWTWSREESGRRFAVSGVRRVFAGVHGSLGSLQALRYAASEARYRRAPLVPVIAWVPPGGDLAERRQPNMQLRKLWRDAAREKLFDAFEMGLGGLPEDLDVQPLVVRGPVGPVLVDCADDVDDLLVVGTGRRGVGRLFRRSASRYCLAHAHCPVVAVPPSALMEEANHGLQIWPRKPRLPVSTTPRPGSAEPGGLQPARLSPGSAQPGPARPGSAPAQPSPAQPGPAQPGSARLSPAQPGLSPGSALAQVGLRSARPGHSGCANDAVRPRPAGDGQIHFVGAGRAVWARGPHAGRMSAV